jgi:hypothetical protein
MVGCDSSLHGDLVAPIFDYQARAHRAVLACRDRRLPVGGGGQ